MNSILDKLWDFYVSEHPFETDPERRDAVNAAADAEEALLSVLDEEQRGYYLTCFDAQSVCRAQAECDAFKAGVRFAAAFLADAMRERD